jgi:dolichol-phosphate mannosyltransferase
MIVVFLPAYNEQPGIESLIRKIQKTMESEKLKYKILVVNDGSQDKTRKIVESLKKELPLVLINHDINRGLWETVRDGFEWAAANLGKGDIFIRMDADDTHDPGLIPQMKRKIDDEGYDVVIASRFQPGGGQKGVSAYRALISRAANLVMKAFFPIPGVQEYSSGYRAYRGAMIRDAMKIFGNAFIDVKGVGFTATLEKLIKFRMMKAKFAEVPLMLRYDQKQSSSKMITSITTIGYFVLILKYIYPWGDTAKGWIADIARLERDW